MTQFGDFEEPTPGDRFIPKDNVGHVVVVKPHAIKTGIVTSNSPDGTDAVNADVVDLDAPDGPAVYRDTLLFGGAFVDAFRPYVGQPQLRVIKIESRKSNSGRTYAAPVAGSDADKGRAEAAFKDRDWFAPEFATVASPEAANAPF